MAWSCTVVAGAATLAHAKEAHGKGGAGKTSTSDYKLVLDVDLNESNHAKLLFANVSKYEDARTQYCDKILGGKTNHAVIKDDATGKELRAMEQLYRAMRRAAGV